MNMMRTMEPPGALQLRQAQRGLRFRRLIALFERDEIEAAVDALIAHLDRIDGDDDIELNGDERDGNDAEDEFGRHSGRGDTGENPGCSISDPGGGDIADEVQDAAWSERINQTAAHFRLRAEFGVAGVSEDAEEDDAGECSEPDFCHAGDDGVFAGLAVREGPSSLFAADVREGLRIGDDVDAEPRFGHLTMDGRNAHNEE